MDSRSVPGTVQVAGDDDAQPQEAVLVVRRSVAGTGGGHGCRGAVLGRTCRQRSGALELGGPVQPGLSGGALETQRSSGIDRPARGGLRGAVSCRDGAHGHHDGRVAGAVLEANGARHGRDLHGMR